MGAWFAENLGTILVTLALAAVVAAIVLGMRKEKKRGRSPCCGDCSGCSGCAACHGGQTPKA